MTNECDDDNKLQQSEPESEPQAEDSQFAQARKALHSIGNSKKSHKNQLLPFQFKFTKKTQEQESIAFNKAAGEGNFPKVISILASQKSDEDRNRVMNEARHRGAAIAEDNSVHDDNNDNQEVSTTNQDKPHHHDHKGWYDLTPLSLAAMNGHANVVEYLLRQGADPTLRGSPSQHEDLNALEAAKKGVKLVQQDIDSVLSSGKDEMFHLPNTHHYSQFTLGDTESNNNTASSALDYAQSLVEKRDQCHLCLALLESVEQFWPLAQSYSSHYRKRSYTNKPKDIKVLRASLDFITLETSPSSSYSDANLQAPTSVAAKESLVNRLAAKIAAAGSKQGKPTDDAPLVFEESNDDNNGYSGKKHQPQPNNNQNKAPRIPKPKRTKMNRGRRHSDSFCIPPSVRSRPVLARAGSFLRDKNIPNLQFA